jgi:hypothetical protein
VSGAMGVAFVTCIWIGTDLWTLFLPQGQAFAAYVSTVSGLPPLLVA